MSQKQEKKFRRFCRERAKLLYKDFFSMVSKLSLFDRIKLGFTIITTRSNNDPTRED